MIEMPNKPLNENIKRIKLEMSKSHRKADGLSALEIESLRLKRQNRIEISPFFDVPADVELTPEYVNNVGNRIKNNHLYADYYNEMFGYLEVPDASYNLFSTSNKKKDCSKAFNIRNCGKHWEFDHYEKQGIYDLQHVYHCHDKFCPYCQKLLQATRLKKYSPFLEDLLGQGKYLYHVVFTIENTKVLTQNVIKQLFNNFKRLVRYFTGDAKNRFNLSKYGFIGALRSLEVTYSSKTGYHPHIHSIFAFDNPLPDNACIVNKFSYKKDKNTGKRVLDRKFTPLEEKLQKIWRLLYFDVKVTPEAVDSLKLGFSCTVDKIDNNNYYEVFKYTVKFEKDDDCDCDSEPMTYEQFATLYNSLYNVHIFQGYGYFYKIINPEDVIDETMSQKYDFIVEQLRLIETPFYTSIKIEDLAFKMLVSPELKFISRKTIFNFLREHPDFLSD